MLFLVTGSPTTIGPQTTTTNPNTVVPTLGSTGKHTVWWLKYYDFVNLLWRFNISSYSFYVITGATTIVVTEPELPTTVVTTPRVITSTETVPSGI